MHRSEKMAALAEFEVKSACPACGSTDSAAYSLPFKVNFGGDPSAKDGQFGGMLDVRACKKCGVLRAKG